MMNGKENLRRAIDFKGPERLPVHIEVNFDWLLDKDEAKRNEIRTLIENMPVDMIIRGYHSPEDSPVPNGTWKDEWSVGWLDDGHGARVTSHPLIDGYHLMDGFAFPEAGVESWFERPRSIFKFNSDKFCVGTVWFTLFERLWMLRGFNNMLMDPYIDPENFSYLRDKIVDFSLAQIDVWKDSNADAVYFSDDWGSQRALLMNPDDWREVYKPSYEKLFRRIRDNGMKVFMHLCGHVTEIIPDLMEIGLSVLNPVQPQAMDVRELSERFGGKLCFYGGVDIQGTMVHGSPEDVREEVRRLVDLFGSFNGGYICSTSHSIMPETPLDNIIALFGALKEYQ
ncbi:MAG: hypothetical protein JXB33_02395 [Clostridia bacterium]|nr:hypothetical protein [Clostridia bacterium]